ncbi:hypothetical protein CVS29_09025 [Arthrobacter psychrochitiniphilus]|uniref:Uncharacterized protein n=1 Tax=Arthrobacter psychrochitiniphilus TaxID=291045 RepID=A0A2V3DQX2_9MICC|nr:hypothetical protein CVS29_09025 [Arthrobacter psychrochitiniphilus]
MATTPPIMSQPKMLRRRSQAGAAPGMAQLAPTTAWATNGMDWLNGVNLVRRNTTSAPRPHRRQPRLSATALQSPAG